MEVESCMNLSINIYILNFMSACGHQRLNLVKTFLYILKSRVNIFDSCVSVCKIKFFFKLYMK